MNISDNIRLFQKSYDVRLASGGGEGEKDCLITRIFGSSLAEDVAVFPAGRRRVISYQQPFMSVSHTFTLSLSNLNLNRDVMHKRAGVCHP